MQGEILSLILLFHFSSKYRKGFPTGDRNKRQTDHRTQANAGRIYRGPQ